jgi:hypothetical protein
MFIHFHSKLPFAFDANVNQAPSNLIALIVSKLRDCYLVPDQNQSSKFGALILDKHSVAGQLEFRVVTAHADVVHSNVVTGPAADCNIWFIVQFQNVNTFCGLNRNTTSGLFGFFPKNVENHIRRSKFREFQKRETLSSKFKPLR